MWASLSALLSVSLHLSSYMSQPDNPWASLSLCLCSHLSCAVCLLYGWTSSQAFPSCCLDFKCSLGWKAENRRWVSFNAVQTSCSSSAKKLWKLSFFVVVFRACWQWDFENTCRLSYKIDVLARSAEDILGGCVTSSEMISLCLGTGRGYKAFLFGSLSSYDLNSCVKMLLNGH